MAVSSGGCPKKLTTANILYAKCMIRTGKIKNAVQASKTLSTLNNDTITPQNSMQCSKVSWDDFCGQTEEAIVGCQT